MTAAPLPAPLPETLKPEWVAETDWRAENDRASAFEHGVIDAGDGLVIILASTDYFYDEEPSRILRFRDELCAAWNRRAPEAQAWRAPPEKAPDEVIVAASEAGRRAFEIATTLTINPSERKQTAGHAIVHYAYLAGWRDAQPLPAPPGSTPAAPPAREAALEAIRYFLDYEDDRDPFRTREQAVARLRAALAEAEGRAES